MSNNNNNNLTPGQTELMLSLYHAGKVLQKIAGDIHKRGFLPDPTEEEAEAREGQPADFNSFPTRYCLTYILAEIEALVHRLIEVGEIEESNMESLFNDSLEDPLTPLSHQPELEPHFCDECKSARETDASEAAAELMAKLTKKIGGDN